MEIANTPLFSQFESAVPKITEIVKKAQENNLLNEEIKNSNINDPELNTESSSINEVQKIEEQKAPPIEFIISNINFGYNSESKDFFVKVNRNDRVVQYPTDEMMKLKAYFMSLTQESSA